MKKKFRFLVGTALLAAGLSTPAAAQRPRNDGFCRRDGQMHVLRNGELRPLLRDARPPTGTVVTKDGFLIAKNGERTELADGQGCDLQGRVVAVEPAPDGSLALGKRAAPAGPAGPPAAPATDLPANQPDAQQAEEAARDQQEPAEESNSEDEKKREEQAREQRKKDEERQREETKRQAENEREARKQEKEQRKNDRQEDD